MENNFPLLKRKFHGRRLIYLDSAATSQRPRIVIETVKNFSEKYNSNVHRGIYALSEEATALYENGRKKISGFIGAKDPKEIIFVRGTTEAINLVASSWGGVNIKRGDEIIVSIMEHHSNFVPWQILAKKKGAKLIIVGLTKEGLLDLKTLRNKLSKRTKLVTLAHTSNFIGTINPIEKICSSIRAQYPKGKAPVILVDGAQAVAQMKIDVSKLGCDFYVFSGHKMYAPMGIGVLWGRRDFLENMPPYQVGGHMIKEVYTDRSVWADIPTKFEAGTPNVSGVVGLTAAVNFLEKIGMNTVRAYERGLTVYMLAKLSKLPFVSVYGPRKASERCGLVAFNLKDIHSHDVAGALDEYGIAVRAGHHCAMPLHTYLHIDSSVRVSFGIYTTKKDIDVLISSLKKVYNTLKPEQDFLEEERK